MASDYAAIREANKAEYGNVGHWGLSRTQFDCAREHGEAYWLYVVESAGTDDVSLARIQDSAGRAKTFTFDHGWRDVAEADDDTKEHEG